MGALGARDDAFLVFIYFYLFRVMAGVIAAYYYRYLGIVIFAEVHRYVNVNFHNMVSRGWIYSYKVLLTNT